MSEKPLKKLTRRDMLKLSGTVAAGAVLASCSSPTPEPTEEAMPEDRRRSGSRRTGSHAGQRARGLHALSARVH